MSAFFRTIAVCWLLVLATGSAWAQPNGENEGTTFVYLELGGKGYLSANMDFGIAERTRLTLGLTVLDYDFKQEPVDEMITARPLPSPSIMLMQLYGVGPRYFELGAGMSVSPVPWKEYSPDESAWSFHGVIGYRYQRPGKMFYRVGFTPFYRVNWMALPLIGLSFGIQI